MEEPIARLQTDVQHLRSGLSDVRTDLQRLEIKVDRLISKADSSMLRSIVCSDMFADNLWWLLCVAILLIWAHILRLI